MKEFINNICKSIGLVLLASVIGLIALILVYNIPTDRIKNHVVESESVLRSQNDETLNIAQDASGLFDTGTNIIMLHEAIYPLSGNPLEDALLCSAAHYYDGSLDQWIDRVVSLAKDGDFSQYTKEPYSRYWHGYLVYLKPLLLLFNLSEIYRLNFVIVIGSIIAVWYFMHKKLGNYSFAYIFMLMTMNVGNIYQSFQLSTAFYAMQMTLLLLLIQNNNQLKKNSWWIFVADGILLAYLDFLTYPMLAFSVPIVVYFLLLHAKEIKTIILELIEKGIFFLIGYGCMWAMKWICATLFTDENVIADAFKNIYHRVGGANMRSQDFIIPTREIAFNWNLNAFLSPTNIVLIILFISAIMILFLMKRKIRFQKGVLMISLCGVLLPIAWIVVVYNHCAQHPHLEWRLFCGILFSIGVLLVSLFEEKKDERINERR